MIRPFCHCALRCTVTVIALMAGSSTASYADAEPARFSPFKDLDVGSFASNSSVERNVTNGGVLRVGRSTLFTTLNPFKLGGRRPAYLNYTFDTLFRMDRSQSGVFHGLLAREIQISDDFRSAVFTLDEGATWHDGTPITAHDVGFTFLKFAESGNPFFRSTLEDVEITVLDDRRISFETENANSWRWIDQLGQVPIQSEAFWRGVDDPEADFVIPMGSGPYKVESFEQNRNFVISRVDTYWGNDHPLNAGLWNFDEIRAEYFFDHLTAIEALKRGDLDLLRESNPAFWRGQYDGPALQEGDLVQSTFALPNPGSMPLLILNTRRQPLDDLRVRQALSLMFRHEWYYDINAGLFAKPTSYYGNTEFAATGEMGEAERAIVAEFDDSLPPSVLIGPPVDFTFGGLDIRERQRRALRLLEEAGFRLENGRLVDSQSGEALTLEFVSSDPAAVQNMQAYGQWLERVGISLETNRLDPAAIQNVVLDYSFDLTTIPWRPQSIPGVFENLFWHSNQVTARGYGLAGLDNPAVDAAIDLINKARSWDDMLAATRVLDRILRAGFVAIPMWHHADAFVAHDAGLSYPQDYDPNLFPAQSWWWSDAERAKGR